MRSLGLLTPAEAAQPPPHPRFDSEYYVSAKYMVTYLLHGAESFLRS